MLSKEEIKLIMPFIEENSDLINENKFDTLYNRLTHNLFHTENNLIIPTWEITYILISSGINILNNMTRLFKDMFENLGSGELIIPSNIEYVDLCALGNTNFEKITFKDRTTPLHIDFKAFRDNRKLKEVILPNNICDLDNFAFVNCDNLTKVSIGPTSVDTPTNITGGAFWECRNLHEIEYRGDFDSFRVEFGLMSALASANMGVKCYDKVLSSDELKKLVKNRFKGN